MSNLLRAGSVVSPLSTIADAKRAVAGLDDDDVADAKRAVAGLDDDDDASSVASTFSMASLSDSDAEP